MEVYIICKRSRLTQSVRQKCEVVSELLLQKIPDPSIGSDFYIRISHFVSDWCPCCIKMADIFSQIMNPTIKFHNLA